MVGRKQFLDGMRGSLSDVGFKSLELRPIAILDPRRVFKEALEQPYQWYLAEIGRQGA